MAVFNEANHESAVKTRFNLVSSLLSDRSMLLSILTVRAVVAPYSSCNILRRILSFPSCISTSMHNPVDLSQTAFNSAPKGCGFLLTKEDEEYLQVPSARSRPSSFHPASPLIQHEAISFFFVMALKPPSNLAPWLLSKIVSSEEYAQIYPSIKSFQNLEQPTTLWHPVPTSLSLACIGIHQQES
jgi:hypothetical protein